MAPFRAITRCVFTLSVMGGTLGGQSSRPGKPRILRSTRSNLFSGDFARNLSANRVFCGFTNIGTSCTDVSENGVVEGAFWPKGTQDSYVFNSGLELAGLIPPNAGFAWAGDTAGAYYYDPRGDQVDATPLTGMLSSRDTADLRTWPAAAMIRDTSIFAAALIGHPSASDEDLWTRYWDGEPNRLGGRTHPMGVVIDQRVMAFNAPGSNADILYLIYTLTNVTASDPATYAGLDPAVRGDYATLGAHFKHANDSAFGISIPPAGFTLDSMYINAGMDADVGRDHVAQNYSNLSLPLGTAFAYEAPFSEPNWTYPFPVSGSGGLAAAPGLVGVKFVRYPLDAGGQQVGIRIFTNTLGSATGYPDPVGVKQMFRYISGTTSTASGDNPCSFQGTQLQRKYCFLAQVSQDTRFFFTSGPFVLAPGHQQTVIVAYFFAPPRDTVLPYVGGDLKPGFPSPGDSIAADSTKVRLIERVAGWVTQKDLNADGVIEENEVTTWPGSLFNKAQQAQIFATAKFLSPQPPDAPAFFLVPGQNRVTVVWQRSPTETVGNPYFSVASDPTTAIYDPNFRHFDVEGYRVYRGLTPNALQVVAQFDYAGTEMEDYIGDFDYQGQCAPEFGVVAACPVPFTGTPSSSLHQPHPLAGDVVQIPPGGRLVTRDGAVVVTVADTAVTGRASGFPPLVDNGIAFSWIDSSTAIRNSFHYYYAVTAFDVNSVRSGPSSLESPRTVKSVQPRSGVAFGGGTIGAPRLLDANGATLTGTAPTLDPATGEFSGPAVPTNGLSLSILSFLPELLDTGSLTVRIDSVLPGLNAVDYSFRVPATYYLSTVSSLGTVDHVVMPLVVDGFNGSSSATSQFSGAHLVSSKARLYGADSSFALVAQTGVSSSGTWDLTGSGRAALNQTPANSDLTGDRWWSGSVNENTPGPTDSLCRPAASACTRTGAELSRSGGVLPGVTFIAPIQAYSTTRSVPTRDLETMTATVYRAADFSVYWGSGGTIDSVVDVTHGLPVPFDTRIGASWGILDSTAFAGHTPSDTPDTNTSVLTWSDVVCVSPANTMISAVFASGCATQAAPLGRTAHLSTMATATGDFGSVPASQGPGFFLYLAGKFWMVALPALPTAGTVWHARYFAGHIVGVRPNLSYVPADPSPPAVPGLRIRLSYSGSSIDLTHTSDSLLARVHTVPDPFYVTNALASSADSQHIEFVHLPPEAIVRIYSVSGKLVALLTHRDPTGGGEESWNVRSRDGRTVASGVYFYVVETADRRTKVGRFTVVTFRP